MPLYTMLHLSSYTKLALVTLPLTIISATACHNKPQPYGLNNALLATLKQNNAVTANSNSYIIHEMQNDMSHPALTKNMAPWLTVANTIREAGAHIMPYLEQMKKLAEGPDGTPSFAEKYGTELFAKLSHYKKAVLSAGPGLERYFSASLPALSAGEDSLQHEAAFKNLFSGSRQNIVLALTMLQNNVWVLENNLLNFCNNKVSRSGWFHDYHFFSTLVVQNTTILRPGETIEVTAGIGAFSTAAQPGFTINGRHVATGPGGTAVYKQKAAGKPGVYRLPVTIEYINPDGKRQTLHKTIHYTVVK